MENVRDYADASITLQMPKSTQKDNSITQSISQRYDGSKKMPAGPVRKPIKMHEQGGKETTTGRALKSFKSESKLDDSTYDDYDETKTFDDRAHTVQRPQWR